MTGPDRGDVSGDTKRGQGESAQTTQCVHDDQEQQMHRGVRKGKRHKEGNNQITETEKGMCWGG